MKLIDQYQFFLNGRKLAPKTQKCYLGYARMFLRVFPDPLKAKEAEVEEFFSKSRSRKNNTVFFVAWLQDAGLINRDKYKNYKSGEIKKLAEEYTAFLKIKGRKKKTRKSLRSKLNLLLSFLNEKGADSIEKVSKKVLMAFVRFLYDKKQEHKGSVGYSPAYRSKVIYTARDFFEFLAQKRHILYNPADILKPPRLAKRNVSVILTLEELELITGRIDKTIPFGFRDYALIEFLYNTGVRPNEAAVAKVKDIDLESRTFFVRNGKGNKDRVVPFSKHLKNLLKVYLKTYRPLTVKKNTDLLFINIYGHRMSCEGISRMIGRYAAVVDKKVTGMTLRHTCATHMLKKGADIRFIQKMLGHESLNTTQIYTKLVITDLIQAVKRFHPMEAG